MFSVLRAQTPVESPHFPITTKTTPAPPHRLHCSKAEYFAALPHPEDNVSNFTSSSRQSNRVFHSTSLHRGPPSDAHIFLATVDKAFPDTSPSRRQPGNPHIVFATQNRVFYRIFLLRRQRQQLHIFLATVKEARELPASIRSSPNIRKAHEPRSRTKRYSVCKWSRPKLHKKARQKFCRALMIIFSHVTLRNLSTQYPR